MAEETTGTPPEARDAPIQNEVITEVPKDLQKGGETEADVPHFDMPDQAAQEAHSAARVQAAQEAVDAAGGAEAPATDKPTPPPLPDATGYNSTADGYTGSRVQPGAERPTAAAYLNTQAPKRTGIGGLIDRLRGR